MINKFRKTSIIVLIVILLLSVVAIALKSEKKQVSIDPSPIVSISFDIEEKENNLKKLEKEEKTEQSIEVLSLEKPELSDAKIAVNNGFNEFFDYHVISLSGKDEVLRKINLSNATLKEKNTTVSLHEDLRYTNFAYLEEDNVYSLYVFSSGVTGNSLELLINDKGYVAYEVRKGVYRVSDIVLTDTNLLAVSELGGYKINNAYAYLEDYNSDENYTRVESEDEDKVQISLGEIGISNLSNQYVVLGSNANTVVSPKAENYENEVIRTKFFNYRVVGGVKSYDQTTLSNVFIIHQDGKYDHPLWSLNKIIFVIGILILFLIISTLMGWTKSGIKLIQSSFDILVEKIQQRSGEAILYLFILITAIMMKMTDKFGDLFPTTYLFALTALFVIILTRLRHMTIVIFMIIIVPIIAVSEILHFQTLSEKSSLAYYFFVVVMIISLIYRKITRNEK